MKIFDRILNLLFPTSCTACDEIGPDLCGKCASSFQAAKIPNERWVASLWNYRDPNVETLMRSLKNVPNRRIASIIATHLLGKIIDEKSCNPAFAEIKNAVIVPIPVGRARLRSRGYNQSLLLARPLAKLLRRSIETDVLKKSRMTKKQGTTKSKAERLENLRDSFAVKNSAKIRGRDVLIIDDITTTGSTLSEARKTLLAAGARRVVAVTVAN